MAATTEESGAPAKDAERVEREELSDKKFIAYLVNEDSTCPYCHRPFLPWDVRPKAEGGDGPLVFDEKQGQWCVEESKGVFKPVIKEGEGYVIPLVLKCNHAVCQDCALFGFESDVVFIGNGVRCHYVKRDQFGNPPSECLFVTPCEETSQLPIAAENLLLTKVMHDTGVMLGNKKNPAFGDTGEFFYYFKYCYHCQQESTMVCDVCHLAACEACWKEHHASEGHKGQTVEEYEKNVIRSHKCASCGETACKYCGICRKFLCRNRDRCYDPCMDPDHLLIEFDPNLIEIKKLESTAVDNSRKMFIHDVHDYLEVDPFIWQASDLESLKRTVWYQEYVRCHGDDGKGKAYELSGDGPADGKLPTKKPESDEPKKQGDDDSDSSGNESEEEEE